MEKCTIKLKDESESAQDQKPTTSERSAISRRIEPCDRRFLELIDRRSKEIRKQKFTLNKNVPTVKMLSFEESILLYQQHMDKIKMLKDLEFKEKK